MIGRRGILGLILGAPIAGASAASEIASGNLGGAAGVASSIAHQSPPEPYETRLLDKVFYKARRRAEKVGEARRTQARHMPPHINEKKSWSTAFKRHVFQEELIDEVEWWDDYKMSDRVKRKLIRKAGLGDLL